MTLPALPASGSTAWYSWASAIHSGVANGTVRGVYLPESYGAVGDGATDDTSAIQQAHDAAAANNGAVLLTDQYLTGPIIIKAPMRGLGRETTGLIAKASLTTHLLRSASWDSLYNTMTAGGGDYNVELTDFFIDVRRTLQSAPISSTSIPTPTATTATTGGTLAANTYGYKIAPTNAFGVGQSSARAQITTTGSTSTVTLSWTAVTGATGYIIYGRTNFGEKKLATVGAVTTWTDTGSATAATRGRANEGNVTAAAGIAIYGAAARINRVHVRNAAGPGIVSEWYDGALPTGISTMESKLDQVDVEFSGTQSLLWLGPHDSHATDSTFAMNSMLGDAAAEDNVLVSEGPLRLVNCHAWGQGRWAFRLLVESALVGCQGEGGRAGQALLMSPHCKIEGGTYFSPQSSTSVGIRVGDATFSTIVGCVVDWPLLYGFSSTTGPALDLQYAAGGNSIAAIVDQDTGTRAVLQSGATYRRLDIVNLGAAATVSTPLQVGGVQAAFLSADQTISSQPLVTVSALTLPLVNGCTYEVEVEGTWQAASTTTNIKFAINPSASGNCSLTRGTIAYATATTSAPSSVKHLTAAFDFLDTIPNATTANVDLAFRIQATITASASGSYGLLCGTGTGGSSTLKAGTRISMRRIA